MKGENETRLTQTQSDVKGYILSFHCKYILNYYEYQDE